MSKTIQEILEDLNDLFADGLDGLDGLEAFQTLKSQAASLGYRIKQQGNKLIAVSENEVYTS